MKRRLGYTSSVCKDTKKQVRRPRVVQCNSYVFIDAEIPCRSANRLGKKKKKKEILEKGPDVSVMI
jgi:hypothetical protein